MTRSLVSERRVRAPPCICASHFGSVSARLARYLGVPRQRLYDFLQGRSRLPDAELMLRLLHGSGERARSLALTK